MTQRTGESLDADLTEHWVARNSRQMMQNNIDNGQRLLFVKRVDCDKTEERSVQIFIPCDKSFSLVF